MLENDHVIGDFTWTAYDNLGEAGTGRALLGARRLHSGHQPGRISVAHTAIRAISTCAAIGVRSRISARPCGSAGTEPRIFTTHPEHYGEGFSGTAWHWYDVLDTWTFDDAYLGNPVKADVYTDADEIAFLHQRPRNRPRAPR